MEYAMMRESLAYFAAQTLSGPPEPPYNGRFLVSEHHEAWANIVHENDRVCILAPRDHGKTWFFDFAYPIWQAWKRPNGVGFIFSATKEQAVRILEDIKQEIETNPKLQHLMPRGKNTKWSSTYIKLANGHRIYARGFGTKVRGAHPSWIVCDDVLNDETAWSETIRTKQVEYFYNAITNMIVPGGQIVVIGTPFHALDLYGDLSKNTQYAWHRFQAWDEETKKPLWPERYNEQRLKDKHAEIGSIRFTREFLCSPVSDDMSLFPSWLFKGPPIMQHQMRLGIDGEWWEQNGITAYMGVDFALSSSVKADYTVIFVMGVDKWGNRWVLDIQRYHGLAYEAQKDKIIETGKKYDCGLIFLESNQMQRIWGDQLIVETDLPIKKFITTGQEKNSLEKGLPSLRILLENKKFRIPRGDRHSIELTNVWMSEMRDFTWQQGKVTSIGEHDDTVMACWICDQAIRAGYFSFDMGEELDDKLSLDEMLQKQLEEPVVVDQRAEGFNPFQILEDELKKQQEEMGFGGATTHSPENPSVTVPTIGYGEDGTTGTEAPIDDDIDDLFTGMPLDPTDWRPKAGAPVPRGGNGWKR